MAKYGENDYDENGQPPNVMRMTKYGENDYDENGQIW